MMLSLWAELVSHQVDLLINDETRVPLTAEGIPPVLHELEPTNGNHVWRRRRLR